MKRKLTFGVTTLCVVLSLMSCSENKQKVIENLAEKFFYYVQEEKNDSLFMLYPALNTQYTELAADSIRFIEFKELGNEQYEVALIRCYSPDNSIDNTVKKNVTLTFEKAAETDSVAFPYIIKGSTGLINVDLIPSYARLCGAIKNKKYTDNEYIERLAIAKEIYMEKAQEIAEYVSKNVDILVNTSNVFGVQITLVENEIFFSLRNNTEYTCKGFTVDMSFENWQDNSYRGTESGYYGSEDATLHPYTTHRYRMSLDHIDKSGKIKNYLAGAVFKITAEAIAECNDLPFTGNEYDEYIKNHPEEKEESLPQDTVKNN